MRWACNAILKHREQVIKWPSIEEQQNISGRVRKVHGFITALFWLMVHCFLWLLHPQWMARIIIQEKVIMLLKGWSFVMMLQELPGLKWDDQVVSRTIEYGQTVRFWSEGVFTWRFGIFNFSSDDSSLQERSWQQSEWGKENTLTPSWQRFISRVSTA